MNNKNVNKHLTDNYKTTLNLPRTKFSMRGNLAKHELEILKCWSDDDLYSAIRIAKKGKKVFILHDGPPYANGNIHIGHSVNKILKDIIIKSKGLAGFDAPYIPGWDCHGLPIELKVEQEYSKPGVNITYTEFRAKCREYATMQINNQREDFIRLGVLADWSHPYLTMDFKTEANIIRALSKIISNGHLYRGVKPVYWCTECCSALAESEIEFYKKNSTSVCVFFEATSQITIKDKFDFFNIKQPILLAVWTTTPWTLPANRAISLSSKFRYALLQVKGKVLIIAKDLIEEVTKRAQVTNYTILSIINGSQLKSIRFKHPFLNYDVPIIFSNHVTLDMGTGAVHIAGAHGPDDFNISLQYNLEVTTPVAPDGSYLPGTHPMLDKMNIFKANDIIISLLRNNNTLFYIETIQHNYPCCWRHKSPAIFRATPQWFISMDQKELRKRSLEAIKKVSWIPCCSQIRIKSMIMNRPDWCISRQRTWGVPMSLFVHKETYELHPCTTELMEKVAKLIEINGIQAWWDLNPEDIIYDNANLYEKVPDILDVWFDSGVTHFSVVDARPEFAGNSADVYLEGSDQHRGWFMSSLITSIAMKDRLPYCQVLTHGFTVDYQKHKMSKSTGNTLSPQSVINYLGADVLRLWVASADYTNEMVISDEILKRTVDIYRRIRNTARFLLANLNDFHPERNIVSSKQMIALDRWAVSCAKEVQEDIISSYESYSFHRVIQRLMRFCSIEMGSFYLDVIKDRQYTTKIDSLARRSCQTALYHIIEALVRWIAPIMSFTASEIWDYIPGNREKYVFTTEWYEKLFVLQKHELMNNAFWAEILKVRSETNRIIEQARINGEIGTSLDANITLYVKPELAKKLILLGDELHFLFLTSDVKVMDYTMATANAKQGESVKEIKIELHKAIGKKCLRCWHYVSNVNLVLEHQKICKRCISNILGNGEIRKFV